jgi:hypothetical protein
MRRELVSVQVSAQEWVQVSALVSVQVLARAWEPEWVRVSALA